MTERPLIAIVGGTGAVGLGLALRWARAGHAVIVGSRSRDKA
ncbi:MAG: NADPH-dependent F420 reductase, partial [Alphaproteobacteria bacterium]|nr:NADPH-dependent F420 reductase [Alphaproteobacteria bacterium]